MKSLFESISSPVAAQLRRPDWLADRDLLLARVRLENFCDLSREEQLYRLRKKLETIEDAYQRSDCWKYIGELSLKNLIKE